VFPHDLPAADTGVDAALAVAVLAATGHLPGVALGEVAVLGELGLDGALRPVSDVTARLAVVAGAGIPHAVVPAGNLTDAVRTPGVTVWAARTLRELVDGLRGQLPLLTPAAWPTPPIFPGADLSATPPRPWHRRASIARTRTSAAVSAWW
jgi:magnesium chelatase family protein